MWFLFGEVSSSSGCMGWPAGYVILLWHSLSLPYNYFLDIVANKVQYIEDIQMFLLNMAFISSSEV